MRILTTFLENPTDFHHNSGVSAVCTNYDGVLWVFPRKVVRIRMNSRHSLYNAPGKEVSGILFLGLFILLQTPTRNSPKRSATQSGPFPKKVGNPPALRAKGTLISEPRFSTPCEMRSFPTRERENGLLREGFSLKRPFSLSRAGKNRISQGVENRGSLISVPLALRGFAFPKMRNAQSCLLLTLETHCNVIFDSKHR